MDRRYFIKSLEALVITTSAGDTFSGMPGKLAEKTTTNNTGPHGVVRKVTFICPFNPRNKTIMLCAYDGVEHIRIDQEDGDITVSLAVLMAEAANSGMGPLIALPPFTRGATTEYISV